MAFGDKRLLRRDEIVQGVGAASAGLISPRSIYPRLQAASLRIASVSLRPVLRSVLHACGRHRWPRALFLSGPERHPEAARRTLHHLGPSRPMPPRLRPASALSSGHADTTSDGRDDTDSEVSQATVSPSSHGSPYHFGSPIPSPATPSSTASADIPALAQSTHRSAVPQPSLTVGSV